MGAGQDGPDARTQNADLELSEEPAFQSGLSIVNVERKHFINTNVDNIIIRETKSSTDKINTSNRPASLKYAAAQSF